MEPELLELLTQTVTVKPKTGRGGYGKKTVGTAVTYPARVTKKQRLVRSADGTEQMSRGFVRLDGNAVVNPQDEITLPDGTTPKILAVEEHRDDAGAIHSIRVFLE